MVVLVTRLADLHGLTFSSISTLSVVLVKQLAAVPGLTLSLVDFILSVVLLKQLAAVPGLTFCMDPCTTDSLKRGIQHDEPVRVALMVGSERMMLSVVSNETDRQSVWDPALGLDC